jgi:arabinofuranosyltransferase
VRWTRTQLITGGCIAAVALTFALLVYHRRWLADDGLIVVRIVRQILEGNGPVFNAAERIEGNTSALWPWLLALGSFVSRLDVPLVTIATGWICGVGALVIAMDANRRWHRARGSIAPLLPFGALMPLGIYAFWDFSTSGLESPLCLLWLAACWWLLVELHCERGWALTAAVVFGLGPLVRPDLAVGSAAFLAAGWLVVRPQRRHALVLALAAAALPLAYEVFRAGYYGMLVPNPALTKSATHTDWDRGLAYLLDFIRPYRMWRVIPVFVAIAILYRKRLGRPEIRLAAAPVMTGLALALYVTRVGGDFMHARLLLPACFAVLLPVMLVPATRWTAIASALVALWSITTAIRLDDGKRHTTIDDERLGYIFYTRHPHPIDPAVFVAVTYDRELVAKAHREHQVITEGGELFAKSAAYPQPVYIAGRLGTTGAAAPLNAYVVDTLGLVHPIGSRITATYPNERPGHQKVLPEAWIAADFMAPSAHSSMLHDGTTLEQIRAATHAVTCGELAELRAAVREPLTFGRFWSNLIGSIGRTRLVIPADPLTAERQFCR